MFRICSINIKAKMRLVHDEARAYLAGQLGDGTRFSRHELMSLK